MLKYDYLIFALILIAFIYSHYSFIKIPQQTIDRMRGWSSTKGKITSAKKDTSTYAYEYTVQGKLYQKMRLSPLHPIMVMYFNRYRYFPEILDFTETHTQEGEEVDVYYNPTNPAEAYLVRMKSFPKSAWTAYYQILVFSLFLTSILFIGAIITTITDLYHYLMQ